MLPAKVERVWLVNSDGGATERRKPAPAPSSGQRHALYRLGLQAVDAFMRERGFTTNMLAASTTTLSYEKKKVLIDITLKKPDNIAFVTSYPGYAYKEATGAGERFGIKAKVVTAKDILGSDQLIQINISTNDAQGTRAPIFVPLPPDLKLPARHVLQQVLGTLAMACDSIPAVRDAFEERAVRAAQTQELEDGAISV